MSLKVSRILHAGYVFEHQGVRIAFDPIFENPFSKNCYAYPAVEFDFEKIKSLRFDAVFISHFHDDHCSLESLQLLDRNTPIYLYCIFEQLFQLIRELGFKNVLSLSADAPVKIKSFEIVPKKALDSDVDSLFQIRAAGIKVLNVVDAVIDPATIEDLANGSPWDLVLWPFQTMLEGDVLSPTRTGPPIAQFPEEWIGQLGALRAKSIVPSSCQFIHETWSWYNHALFPISYRQFQSDIESALPEVKVIRLNPGQSLSLSSDSVSVSPSLDWVRPVGDQNVDYEYRPHAPPQTTQEISQYFEELTAAQRQKVLDYCQSGLMERYRSLERCEDFYFRKKRIWELRVFDHAGRATTFQYQLDGSSICEATNCTDSVSWTTEIPMAKLFGALENGESLTSLYIRINDPKFAPKTEQELEFVDLLNDPLIRCLFTTEIASYQKAQLRRIQAMGL